MLDVSPHALSVPDIDSYVGLMHTLFTLEDNYGLKISEMDGEISQEEYDRWRYHYPEYDGSQIRAKVPPEGLI